MCLLLLLGKNSISAGAALPIHLSSSQKPREKRRVLTSTAKRELCGFRYYGRVDGADAGVWYNSSGKAVVANFGAALFFGGNF